MDNCKHEFVSYKQCCYCGAFENAKNEIIEVRAQSNVEDLRQSFIEWYSGVKETNGGYPPLAMQIFYWFDKNAGLFNLLTNVETSK